MPGTLQVDIVAPDKRVFRGHATGVRVPGAQGSFEIRFNHAPMIAALAVGPLTLTLPASAKVTYATSGGFIEVVGNVVTVLAETVEPASEIDLDRARAAEQRARELLLSSTSEVDRQRAERALERARNRARVAMSKVGVRETS